MSVERVPLENMMLLSGLITFLFLFFFEISTICNKFLPPFMISCEFQLGLSLFFLLVTKLYSLRYMEITNQSDKTRKAQKSLYARTILTTSKTRNEK